MRTTNDLQASALDFAHRVLDAVFETYRDGRSERLRELCDSNLKVFGTAAHEKAHDLEGFLRLFPATPEAGFEATSWRFDFAETFTEDRVGWVWGEVESRLKTGGEWIDFPIRTTFVMHLVDGNTSDEAFCWRLLHFHCSFPDQQQPDEYLDVDALQAHSRMLEEKVAARTAELERSLDELRRTQKQLIQQEKLASLGALTAGIAHEIKNPLNFVNNFA
ncbi:MAG TPA: nuclear transport factor 2 family protein, partial [Rhodothermales bacterium]|nr:nuclear transport factor 2 family protein [Rhodothermales bacterium]